MKHSRVFMLASFCTLGGLVSAQAPPIQCMVNSGIPPIIRAGGEREQISNVLLICAGGVPALPGMPLPLVNVKVTLDTALTTRYTDLAVSNLVREAVLLIDEPGSPLPGADPNFRYCPANSAPNTCDDKNIFAGKPVPGDPNSILFQNIPFNPPGLTGMRIFRIANLRARTPAIPSPPPPIPVTVRAVISMENNLGITLTNPSLLVAFALEAINLGLRDANNPSVALLQPVVLNGCDGNNAHLARKPDAKKYDEGRTLILRIGEFFPSAMMTRAGQWPDADNPPTAPAMQAVPGVMYNTESGFAKPDLPATDNIDKAGQATSGTRLLVRFENVPEEVVLFTSLYEFGMDASNSRLRRIETDGAGKGAATPSAAANPFEGGLLPLDVIAPGVHQAVYEVAKADPGAIDSYNLPVVVAFSKKLPAGGTIRVKVMPGPLGDGGVVADFTAPLFKNIAAPLDAVTISLCEKK